MSGLVRKKLYDTVIVGGGAVGASTAYHLAEATKGTGYRIAVIDRDFSYAKASCMLSAGGIRQHFSIAENVKMSIFGVNFLKNINILKVDEEDEDVDVQFHEHGYLLLGQTAEHEKVLRSNNKVQHECGANWLHILNSEELEKRYNWLDTKGGGITVGSNSTGNEGYFDPWSYVNALKKKSMSLGVDFIEASVVGGDLSADTKSGAMEVTALRIKGPNGELGKIRSDTFVNAAGAWTSFFMNTLCEMSPKPIVQLPVEARKRCVFQFRCSSTGEGGFGVPDHTTPLVVLPGGAYFRPEGAGGRFIGGISPVADKDPHCSSDEDLLRIENELFEEQVWPQLFESVPAFGEIKVQNAWAGFYEYNTLDQNAIIGVHPDLRNFYHCTGFSGHGLQQSPAAGRAISELLVHGQFQTIDLSRFSFDRILRNEPLFEQAII